MQAAHGTPALSYYSCVLCFGCELCDNGNRQKQAEQCYHDGKHSHSGRDTVMVADTVHAEPVEFVLLLHLLLHDTMYTRHNNRYIQR